MIFTDNPRQELLEGARVWIAGVEVTARINTAISVTRSGTGGIGSVNFGLSNANEGFTLTQANVGGQFQTAGNPGEYSEAIKKALFEYKSNKLINGRDPRTGERRWPLAVNSLMLHTFDPVWVVESWPYTQEDLWIPSFKGYVESKPVSEDYISGRSTIQVSCSDIRTIMGRMRVQMNYLIANQLALVTDTTTGEGGDEDTLNALDPVIQDGLFADLQQPTILTTPLAGLSLKDTIEFLVTGRITETQEFKLPGYSNAARQEFLARLAAEPVMSAKGVGKMKMGIAVAYPRRDGKSPEDVRMLEEWHRLSLFGVTGSDRSLPEDLAEDLSLTPGQRQLFSANGRPWTTAEVEEHGSLCTWDGPTAPHNMSVHFLLPSTEGGMTGITGFTTDSLSPERKWQSRLSIIEDYLGALDYHMTVSPVGDILVEFPMYDFKPESFGEFTEAFTVKHDGQGKSSQHEQGIASVPTAMIVTAGYNPQIETLGQLTPANFNESESTVLRVVLQAPVLASRIGMSVEPYTMPFALDSVCRLRQFAVLRFQRALSEANSLSLELVYRPLFMPNRPIRETFRDSMAWISQVSIQNHPGRPREYGHASTSLTLKYVRERDEDGVYRLVTGSEYMPLSYTGEGVAMEPQRGILIDDSLSVQGACGEEAVGAPPQDFGSVLPGDPSEGCETDEGLLASDVMALWSLLRNQARSRLALDLTLTCTHRSGDSESHENITPDLHILSPARAFDISITKNTGASGDEIDYQRVGEMGQELGLAWGGASPSTTASVSKMRALALDRATFHVNRSTDYVFGGTFDTAHFMGVDCSGFIVDCYRVAGILSRSDSARTADQLEKRFQAVTKPQPGDLAFFGGIGATHVMMVDQGGVALVGASGGTQNVQTITQARAAGARVKRIASGIKYRKDFRGYASPFQGLRTPTAFINHFSKA